ncbi:hypothetical protein CEXT_577991 [Caerostris extrusa]|uniref:Uncharacterized protein n=1 Tax=Caerostris extrusa TaxID=172846 RepID=A0AAV4S8J2_CAEEX|nr:hypothetical protein CEXT_577991 [Caerostris extrusa]
MCRFHSREWVILQPPSFREDIYGSGSLKRGPLWGKNNSYFNFEVSIPNGRAKMCEASSWCILVKMILLCIFLAEEELGPNTITISLFTFSYSFFKLLLSFPVGICITDVLLMSVMQTSTGQKVATEFSLRHRRHGFDQKTNINKNK